MGPTVIIVNLKFDVLLCRYDTNKMVVIDLIK